MKRKYCLNRRNPSLKAAGELLQEARLAAFREHSVVPGEGLPRPLTAQG